MLRKLLWRDGLLNARMLLINYAIFAAFQAYFLLRVESARAWLVFASVYAAFVSLTVLTREDQSRATALTCTLPVTRRDVVRARFAGAWLLAMAALATGTILAAVIPGSRVAVADVFRPETLLLAATAITIIVGLMLPFVIRFGLLGLIIFLVGAQVIGVGVLLLAGSFERREGRRLSLGFSAIADGVRAAQDALPNALFYALAVALLVAVNLAGYRLARCLFERRDL
jgi:ABC-type transport system involved in multi-copper enzyme maturation permease subunit